MGLRVRLRPNEPLIVNGCVVRNGDRRNTLTVSSYGQVLRAKYILQEQDADSPARKLYFEIQTMLIEGEGAGTAGTTRMEAANRAGSEAFREAAHEDDQARILNAMDAVHMRDFYRALCELRPLIAPQIEERGRAA